MRLTIEDLRRLPGELRALKAMLPGVRPLTYDLAARARVAAALDGVIVQFERSACGAVTFRPANDSGTWWIGPEDDPRLYPGAPLALAVAWRAIHGGTVPIASLVRPGAKRSSNAARNQLRAAATWVERQSGCVALAAALRRVKVDKHGFARYVTLPDAPRIVT